MENKILETLPFVEKPARYLGKEINTYFKEFSHDKVKVALSYPDLYEIGMSSLGLRIIYGIINERKDSLCERFFSPFSDMEEILKKEKICLFTLETKRAVKEFDIVAFSLSSELDFTNFLNLLYLAEIPIFSKYRKDKDPIVIAGGNCCFNPVVLENFIDAFVIGEGEEVINEIIEVVKEFKKQNRLKLLEKLSKREGVYVPLFKKENIKKRVVKDFNNSFFPVKWVVPLMEIIHDRISVEIMRGCGRGCKFCQAGFCWRPVRIKSVEKILEIAKESYKNSGYSEISLLSFSSGDHPYIDKIIEELLKEFSKKKVSISFPSLRIDTFSFELALRLKEIKKTGLTFAPETSENLRYKLGKKIKDEEIISQAEKAKKGGWRQIKLYFMIGLPEEDEKELNEVVNLINEISKIIMVKASFNTFIPKPHTPLERERFITREEYEQKRVFITEKLKKNRYVKFNFHPYEMSCIECIVGRGDERLNEVIYNVWKNGGKMENWKEHFKFSLWEEAFNKAGIDMEFYLQERKQKELPWHFIKPRG